MTLYSHKLPPPRQVHGVRLSLHRSSRLPRFCWLLVMILFCLKQVHRACRKARKEQDATAYSPLAISTRSHILRKTCSISSECRSRPWETGLFTPLSSLLPRDPSRLALVPPDSAGSRPPRS